MLAKLKVNRGKEVKMLRILKEGTDKSLIRLFFEREHITYKYDQYEKKVLL